MGSISPKVALTSEHIAELQKLLNDHNDESKILQPGDEGYDASIKRYSSAAIKKAPASLQPLTPETIALVLPYIVKNNIELAVKGGGHSTGGASSTATGLVIDLAKLKSIDIDLASKTFRVGGGANWGEVDAALAAHGLATVGGTVSDTGVGGLILGGGFGYLTGQYGLTIDNLLSIKTVLASGEIVTASEKENSDLFWGLRGAGHNFGIAVEFTIKAFPLDKAWAGMLIFPPPLLAQVVEAMNVIFPTLNGKCGGGIAFARPPPAGGQPVVLVIIVYDGPEEEGKEAFKALLDLGPIVNEVKTRPWTDVNRMLDPPPGLRSSLKGATYNLPIRPEFAQKMLDSFIQFTESTPDAAPSLFVFELMDTAKLSSLASNRDMAFPNRGTHLNGLIGPHWSDPANDAVCRQWARDAAAMFKEELEEAKKKGKVDADKDAAMIYGNYEHYDESGTEVYGVNYAKLADLKKKYDPTNIFNKNFPITPSV